MCEIIVLLMMGMLVPETCWGNKLHILSHLVGSLPFTMSTMHGHMNIKFTALLLDTEFDKRVLKLFYFSSFVCFLQRGIQQGKYCIFMV
jgi:hypothetical protein